MTSWRTSNIAILPIVNLHQAWLKQGTRIAYITHAGKKRRPLAGDKQTAPVASANGYYRETGFAEIRERHSAAPHRSQEDSLPDHDSYPERSGDPPRSPLHRTVLM
jgi:hypothetical protein